MSRAGLFMRLEDLGNELAYIDSYPERFPSVQERAVRRVAVLSLMIEIRSQLIMPPGPHSGTPGDGLELGLLDPALDAEEKAA